MPRIRRLLYGMISLLGVVVALAGCGGGETPSGREGDPGLTAGPAVSFSLLLDTPEGLKDLTRGMQRVGPALGEVQALSVPRPVGFYQELGRGGTVGELAQPLAFARLDGAPPFARGGVRAFAMYPNTYWDAALREREDLLMFGIVRHNTPIVPANPGTTRIRFVQTFPFDEVQPGVRYVSHRTVNPVTNEESWSYELVMIDNDGVTEASYGPYQGKLDVLSFHAGSGTNAWGLIRTRMEVQREYEEGTVEPFRTVFDGRYLQTRLDLDGPLPELDFELGSNVVVDGPGFRWLTSDYPSRTEGLAVTEADRPLLAITIRDEEGVVVQRLEPQPTSRLAFEWDSSALGLARLTTPAVRSTRRSAGTAARLVPLGSLDGQEPSLIGRTSAEGVSLQGESETPRTFTYEVEFLADAYPPEQLTPSSQQTSCLYLDQGLAMLDINTLVEVLDPETDQRLATSNKDYPGIRDLLSKVYPANLQGRNRRIKVRALVPAKPDQQTLDAKVRTSHTNPGGVDVRLNRVPGTNRFEGEVELDERLLRQPESSSATSLDTYDLDDSQAFEEGMRTRFGSGSPLMGRMWDWGPHPDDILSKGWSDVNDLLDQDNVPAKDPTVEAPVYSQQEAFRAAGYEILQVDVPGRSGSGGAEIAARMRVRNQAARLYISGHGDGHKNKLAIAGGEIYPGMVIGDQGTVKRPITLEPVHWQDNLRVLIVSGCSVLNINNYNGWWTEPVPNGGLVWDHVLGNPGRRAELFGYNQAAPAGPIVDTRIVKKFLGTAMAPCDWLEANAPNTPLDSSCAIDANYYYFIRHDWRRTGETAFWKPGYIRVVHLNRWFVRVPRSDWTRPDPKTHRLERLGNQLDDVKYWVQESDLPHRPPGAQ